MKRFVSSNTDLDRGIDVVAAEIYPGERPGSHLPPLHRLIVPQLISVVRYFRLPGDGDQEKNDEKRREKDEEDVEQAIVLLQ